MPCIFPIVSRTESAPSSGWRWRERRGGVGTLLPALNNSRAHAHTGVTGWVHLGAEPNHPMKTKFLFSAAVAGLMAAATLVFAQFAGPRGGANPDPASAAGPDNPSPARGTGPGALPGFFAMLDTDYDGLLSVMEIAAAPDVLRKVDKNSDGQLTLREIGQVQAERGPRPDTGRRGGGQPGNLRLGGGPQNPGPGPQGGGYVSGVGPGGGPAGGQPSGGRGRRGGFGGSPARQN